MPIYIFDSSRNSSYFYFSNDSALWILGAASITCFWGTLAAYTVLMNLGICLSVFAATLIYLYIMHASQYDVMPIWKLCANLTPEMIAKVIGNRLDARASHSSL